MPVLGAPWHRDPRLPWTGVLLLLPRLTWRGSSLPRLPGLAGPGSASVFTSQEGGPRAPGASGKRKDLRGGEENPGGRSAALLASKRLAASGSGLPQAPLCSPTFVTPEGLPPTAELETLTCPGPAIPR